MEETNVKPLLIALTLAVTSTVAHAQINCQTYGNTTNCQGSLGSHGATVPVQPAVDFNAVIRGQQEAQAAQMQARAAETAANAQAELAHAQAEAIRQQTAVANSNVESINEQGFDIQQQRILEKIASASDEELHKVDLYFSDAKCSANPSCSRYALFAFDAIRTETHRRIKLCMARFQELKPYNPFIAYDRCKADTASAPPPDVASVVKIAAPVSAPVPPPTVSSTADSEFHQKFDALGNAFENGVITRAEYDKKLSALMQTRQARNNQ